MGCPGPAPELPSYPRNIFGASLAWHGDTRWVGQTWEDILAIPFISTPWPLCIPRSVTPCPRSLVMCGGADWGGPVADCFSWSARWGDFSLVFLHHVWWMKIIHVYLFMAWHLCADNTSLIAGKINTLDKIRFLSGRFLKLENSFIAQWPPGHWRPCWRLWNVGLKIVNHSPFTVFRRGIISVHWTKNVKYCNMILQIVKYSILNSYVWH